MKNAICLPFTISNSPTLGIRGIIATEDIAKNKVIERCPVVLIKTAEASLVKKTKLINYYFEWNKKYIAIALGYGSLFNHSFEPNVRYCYNYSEKILAFKTLRRIKMGEELTVNYNGDPEDKNPLEEVALNFDKTQERR